MEEFLTQIQQAAPEVQGEFEKYALRKKVEKGEILSVEGGSCGYIPLVERGLIRVFKIGSSGREVTLYRIGPGESCILTVSCALTNKEFPAVAKVEKEGEIFLIPSPIFKDWLERFAFWKKYVFELLSKRLLSILEKLDDISFRRLDGRVAEFLLNHLSENSRIVHTTHQEIARELGSSREVISRILKDLEKERVITLHRGKIEILNPAALRRLVNG